MCTMQAKGIILITAYDFDTVLAEDIPPLAM